MGQGDPNRDSHVLLNDGSGKFSEVGTPLPSSFFAPNQNVVDISPGDINNDGFVDLLVVDTDGPTYNGWHIQVLINNQGDGTFSDETKARLKKSGSSKGWMFWADLIDLNMDGKVNQLDLNLLLQYFSIDRLGSISLAESAFWPGRSGRNFR